MRQINSTRYGWRCYDGRTGMLVNCQVSYQLIGVGGRNTTPACAFDASGQAVADTCANGGHTHSGGPAQPLVVANSSTGESGDVFFAGDLNSALLFADGFSTTPNPPFTVNTIRHDVSQVGGYYQWESRVFPRPGRTFFNPNRFPDGSIRADGKTHVRVPGIGQIPTDNTRYLKVRSPDSDHTDAVAFGSIPKFREALRLIGFEYTDISGRQLSINDMSLPYGGVFDLGNNWVGFNGGHEEHRDGTEADINRGFGCGPLANLDCDCLVDHELFQAIDKYLLPFPGRIQRPGKGESALLCESLGRKHINFLDFLDVDL